VCEARASGAILPDETPYPGKGDNTKHWMAYGAKQLSVGSSVSTNRTAELFVSLADNTERLAGRSFAAFAYVIEGAETLDEWYAGYGEMEGLCDGGGGGGSGGGGGRAESQSPSPSHASGLGSWACLGPNEQTLYALGGGRYVEGNFSKMDRIRSVHVREYHGAWGPIPGPGAKAVSWSCITLVVILVIAGYLRWGVALKAHRAYW